MNCHFLNRRKLLALAGMGLLPSTLVRAEEAYPSRTVKLLHGFGAGSSIDVVARILGQKLSAAVAQPVVVVGQPGATGTIANQTVINSPPDGYTLLIAPLAAVVTASYLYPVKYNSLKDLVPVLQVAFFDTVLVAGPSVAATNVSELVALAKARSEPFTYSSPGAGTGFHLAGELLAQMADIKLLHVPYRGGGTSAFTDVLGGRIDLTFESLGTVLPYLRSGRLRALAVTGSARSPALAEVPTMAESGLLGYQLTGWHGVFAPVGTPPSVVQKLNMTLMQVMGTADMQQRWATMNLRYIPMLPETFGRLIAADHQRYGKIIRELGIKVE